MSEASDIPNGPFPSYHPPLALARDWVRNGGEERNRAIVLLRKLRQDYRHILAIGHELVFALQEAGRNREAVAELDALDRQFVEVDEETLCRRGRDAKEDGDAALKANDLVQAERSYRRALVYYSRAYALPGTHYSGVNKATVQLLLAGVAADLAKAEESESLVLQAQQQAGDLLACHEKWPMTLPDDNIWHLLTLGEVYLLLRQWLDAARAYERAFAESKVKRFHFETAGKQARRIIEAWRRLRGEADAADFPLEALFAPPRPGESSGVAPS